MNIIEISGFNEDGKAIDSNGDIIIIRNNAVDHCLVQGVTVVDKVEAIINVINE